MTSLVGSKMTMRDRDRTVRRTELTERRKKKMAMGTAGVGTERTKRKTERTERRTERTDERRARPTTERTERTSERTEMTTVTTARTTAVS